MDENQRNAGGTAPNTPPQGQTNTPQAGQTGGSFQAPQTNTWAQGMPQNNTPLPGGLPNERELQNELENQIRAFGGTISDGFRFGFDGRGAEIGDRAKNMGSAFMDIMNYGIAKGQQSYQQSQARNNANRSGGANPYGNPNRNGNYYNGSTNQRSYVWASGSQPKNPLRSRANNRFGIGLAQVIVGGIMLFCFGVGGSVCFGLGLGLTEMALFVTGVCLLAASLPFLWMTIRGAQSLKASGLMRTYASIAGLQEKASIASLAQASQRSVTDTKKAIRKMIRRGWITAWLDEDKDMLYFSEQAYYATVEAEEKAAREAALTEEQREKEEKETRDNATLSSMKNFIDVLEKEKPMMADDPQAVAELNQMQKSCGAIFEWVKEHPASMPKAQRLANYYIPTTLKLLHTYNEVGTTGGDNAQSIRRDVAGMLHSLNTAFSNLHDNLLSDVALDVSSEISAMQGMLARDGLSENDMLKPQQ